MVRSHGGRWKSITEKYTYIQAGGLFTSRLGGSSISSPEPPLLLSSGVIPVAVQKDRGLWERDWRFFEAEPRFGVKVVSRLTQPQNRKDEPITPDYFRTLWITIFVFRLNLPSFYLWVSLITYKPYKAEADTGMWITQKALQYNKTSLYLCVIEIHGLCFFSFLCSLFVLLLTTLTLRG